MKTPAIALPPAAPPMSVPPSYGVGVTKEAATAVSEQETTLVRLERHVRSRVEASPAVIVVDDSASALDANPFGNARRLMTPAEAPDMFGIARDMAAYYTKLEQEREELDRQIQLLIDRRVRTDTTLTLMGHSLRAYARSMDLDDIMPETLKYHE